MFFMVFSLPTIRCSNAALICLPEIAFTSFRVAIHMPVKSFSLIFFQIILLFGFYCLPFAAAGVNVEPEISADIATNFDSEKEALRSQLAARLDRDIRVLRRAEWSK